MSQDDYGYFGPSYSFADNIPLPGSIGVRQDSSIDAVLDSVSAVNTYVDIIAFGGKTFFDQQDIQPMGIRYFMNTGMMCSNGATMSEYFDGVTQGNILGETVQQGLASAGLPGLKGLAPGILENARDALNPMPLIAAVSGTGYPVCQQVMCPVGDVNGKIADANTPSQPYILGDVTYVSGIPYQTRWVQASDSTGSQINITKDEFGVSPKCYNADGTYMTNPPAGCTPPAPQQGVQATGDFALCKQIQGPVLPPPLQAAEGFTSGPSWEELAAAVAVVAVGGAALWLLGRR